MRSPIRAGCANQCAGSAHTRITWGRPTTRTTPSGCARSMPRTAGMRRSNSSRCSFPYRSSASWNWWPRRSSWPRSRNRAVAVDPTSSQKSEQLPTYNAYSADGDVTAPLVYVNYGVPDDYDVSRAAWHLGQGRHRDCALWRLLAGHQAEGRRRAWRRGLPDLLRSGRRRLCRRRDVSRRTVPPEGRRPAWQRDGHAGVSGRPADAGRWCRRRAPSGSIARTPSPSCRSPCCRSRTPTPSRCSRRSTGPVAPAAWRGGLPITYRPRTGRSSRAPEAAVRLEPQAAL